MIEVKNLVKKYGSHLAVDHLNFTVDTGQIYGFLGPNGAGKSTTMNIMTGYLGATEGEVLINGHNILEEPEAAKKCIGYLPEMPPLYTDMKVNEYLRFVAELKKIPKKERQEQIEKVMLMVKIMDVQDRLIKNLSKGYKQRVGLAQAILGFPEIIILDEPTVGLDPKQIIEIRELIRELAKEHTVILSSHILAEIQEVCDYIMIISKGKLVASDTPENLEKLLTNQQTVEILAKGNEDTVRKVIGTIGIRKRRRNGKSESVPEGWKGYQGNSIYGICTRGLPVTYVVSQPHDVGGCLPGADAGKHTCSSKSDEGRRKERPDGKAAQEKCAGRVRRERAD